MIGFDLAGDEGTYPLDIHKEAFIYAKINNIPATCHTGEFPEKSNPSIIENLKLAAELEIKRIGHGVALRSVSK